jgi:sporulation protein YlmC with PRC-barrel domain
VGQGLAFFMHMKRANPQGGVAMTTVSGHTNAIRAGKAIGTDVHDRSGKKIGEVKDIVLEKTTNNILFAVVSFGGVLGIGEKYHPVPWSELDYDPKLGGYVVSFTADQLKNAPADSIDALTRDDGRAFRDRAYKHYGTKPYWH